VLSPNFAMMVRVRGEVSVEQLNTALSRVRVRHPALAPADTAGNQASFPLAVRAECGDDDWIEVAQAQLRESFPDPAGPFARFTLLRRAEGFDVVAAFHHGICDGMSGMFVLRDVLQVLGNPQLELAPLPAPPPTGALIPQAVLSDPRLQLKVGFALAMLRAQVWLEKVRRRLSSPKQSDELQAQKISTENPSLEQQFVILPGRLTVSQTAALVARCKQEQVSVHAAVCVAWLRAFTGGATKSHVRTVSSPVNLRQRLSPPVGETSGLFLSIVETTVDCAPERDFWDVAREFKQKLSRDSRDETLLLMPLLFSKIFSQVPPSDHRILLRLLFSRPVTYDFSITNLGRVVIPERNGALQVEAFYGPLVNSSAYERTVGVSTLAEQMSLAFIFRQSMLAPASGRELLEHALGLLARESRNGHTA